VNGAFCFSFLIGSNFWWTSILAEQRPHCLCSPNKFIIFQPFSIECITIYVFIFVGVNFCGFHGHLVIRENNIIVNPQKNFILWTHENFRCSVAALLAQWFISFKVPPYGLPHHDDAYVYYFFIFHYWNSKKLKFSSFSP